MARHETAEIDQTALMQSVARRDEEAIIALYRSCGPRLFHFIVRRVDWRHEDAEEIMQDTFVSALQLSPTYAGSSSVFTWLCGIAKLRIIDYYRRVNSNRRIPADRLESFDPELIAQLRDPQASDDVVQQAVDRLDAARLSEHILRSLSDDEREALTLQCLEGFSVRELAQLTNRTEKAVERLLARARKHAAAAVGKLLSDR